MIRDFALSGLTQKLVKIAFVLTLLFMLVPTSVKALALPSPNGRLVPTHLAAAGAGATCGNKGGGFFGLEPWYQYLPDNYFQTINGSSCDLKCFNLLPMSGTVNDCGRAQSDLPLVLLAIIDDLLRVAGMVAVIFVLYGAVKYTTSQGSPDATSEAQSTVINALLGMAIAMIAVLVVSYIGNALT